MINPKLDSLILAVGRFEEALKLPEGDTTRDSAIMRFQFCYDLSWKTLKEELKMRGLELFSPRECFKSAIAEGLLGDEESWLKMIDDRNEIAHVYDMTIAKRIYSNLADYLTLFQNLIAKLSE